MLNKGNYYSEQTRNEKIEKFIHRHIISFLPWVIISIVWFFLPIFIFILDSDLLANIFNSPYRFYIIVGLAIYYLFHAASTMNAWINYYFNVSIITTQHLVDIRQSGIFNRKVSEQSLLRVQDVSSRMKGLLQTFFRYGTVLVETAGEAPNFEMKNIPQPYKIANTIIRLHEQLVEETNAQPGLAQAEGVLIKKSSPPVQEIVENQPKPAQEEVLVEDFPQPQNNSPKNSLNRSQGQLMEGQPVEFD